MGYDNFYIDPTEVYFDGNGGSQIVQINNMSGDEAADGWSLNCNSSLWCTMTIENQYSNDTIISIYAPSNPTNELRQLEVQVLFNGNYMGDLYIEQDAGTSGGGSGSNTGTTGNTGTTVIRETSVDNTSLSIGGGESAKATTTLRANYNCYWSEPDYTVNWLDAYISNNGSEAATLTITTTQANPNTSTRTAKVYVTDEDGEEYTIQVTQAEGERTSSIYPAYIEPTYTGGTYYIDLTANYAANWSVDSEPSWVSTSFTKNSRTDSELKITITSHSSAEERDGKIVLRNNHRTHNVEIRQEGAPYSYSVNPTSLSYTANGSTKNVTLTANGYANYTTYSKPDWITVNYEGNGSDSVVAKLTASANSTVDDRSGVVKFTPNGSTILSVNVSQVGIEKQTSVSATAVTIGSGTSKTTTVDLTANYNCDWDYHNTVSWMDVSISNDKTKKATLTITTTQANPYAYTRNGNITVSDDNGGEWKIQVTQTAAGKSSSVSPSTFDIVKNGDTVTASMISNWDTYWEITKNGSWCNAKISNNGGRNATLTITAGKNPNASERTDRITVKNDDRSHNIEVRQDAGDWVYSVDPTSLSYAAIGGTKNTTLTANGYANYTVYSKPNWCSVDFVGNGSESVIGKITANANDTIDSRSGTVVFTPNNGSTKLNVDVSQVGIEKETSISATAVTIGSGVSATNSITLSANYSCNWSADSTVSWLDATITGNNTKNTTLTFKTTQSNPNAYTRMGKVNVSDDNGNEWIVQVTQVSAPYISSVSPQLIEPTKTGGTFTTNLISNWDTYWEISKGVDWCTSKISNNGGKNAILTVSMGTNPSAGERTGRINVKNDYYNYNVDVRQDAGDWVYNVHPTSLTFGVNASTKSVDLTANGYANYTVYSKPDWVSVDFEGNGSEDVTAKISVTNNTSVDTRTGVVKFTPNGGNNILSVDITQTALDRETSISATAVTIGSGVSRTVKVDLTANYNCDWTFDSTVNWLDGTITNDKTYNATLTITATQANPKAATRMGKVYVLDDIGNEYLIQVTQDKGDVVSSVTPQLMSDINKNGETRTATLTSNWDTYWEITSKPDWVSTNISDNGGQNATLNIIINLNSRAEERTGNIAIKNNIHSFGVKLIQDAADMVYSVSPTSLSYNNVGGTKSVTLTANGYALYRVYSKPDWCSAEFEGNGSDSVKANITVEPNDVTDDRNGIIKFTPDDGTNLLEVSLEQSPIDKETSIGTKIGDDVLYVGSGYTSDDLVLNANYDCVWNAGANFNSAYTKTIIDNGTKSAILRIETIPNTDAWGKIYAFTLTADNGDSYDITINKAAGGKTYKVEPTEIIAAGSGGTYTITCTANGATEWMVLNRPESFIGYSWHNENGAIATLTLTIGENPYERQQNGSVVISADNGAYSISIPVKQLTKSDVNITPTEFNISKNAQRLYVTANTNYDTVWTATENEDWLSVSTNVSMPNYEWFIIIDVVELTNGVNRTGYVYATDASGTTHTITINQTGGDRIFELSKSYVEVQSGATVENIQLITNYKTTPSIDNGNDWFSVQVNKENDNLYNIQISILAQDKADVRQGIFTVYDEYKSAVCTINQNSTKQWFKINPTTVNLKFDGKESAVVSLTSNYSSGWTFTKSVDWLNVELVKLDDKNYNANLRITGSYNAGLQRRTSIVIRKGNEEVILPVVQDAYSTMNFLIENNYLLFPEKGGYQYVKILKRENVDRIDCVSNQNWCNAYEDGNEIVVYVNPYIGMRTAVITVTAENGVNTPITETITVTQMESDMRSIWKDNYIETSSYSDSIVYNISKNGGKIFTGMLNKNPETGKLNVYMNDVISNFLGSTFSFQSSTNYAFVMEDYVSHFAVIQSNGTPMANDFYYNDWSYTDYVEDYPSSLVTLTDNVFDVLDHRQFFMQSYLNKHTTNTATVSNGLVSAVIEPAQAVTLVSKNPANGADLGKQCYITLTANGRQYKVMNTGKDYCIYYKNAYGGYDWLVVDGISILSSSIKKNVYRQRNNNNTIGFSKVNYQNDITDKIQFNTGFLSDAQSQKMQNLFTSTEVYVHNLKTGEIKTGIITDSTYTEKTYKNQGCKYFNHTFNIELSNMRMIK